MYSIVIPIYNEQETIAELLRRVQSVVDRLDEKVEIILIEDGSTDDSFELLRRARQKDSRLKILRLSRNFGHQVALSAGISHTKGKAVVLMDGDLQDPPELIPQMITQWKQGYQVVYTVKRSRRENFIMRFAFHSFYRLMRVFSSVSIPMEAGNFSLLDRRVVDTFLKLPERHRYISGLRAWVGFRQTGIEYDREPRFVGKPQMTLSRLINLALDGLFSFSNAPLRLATYAGFIVASLSFLLAAYVIYEKLFTDKAILGWASTIVSITFIGGMILLTLGVIGEYIGRIYDEVKQRPLYVIKEKIGLR